MVMDILIGTMLGFLAGLGVGGGSLLILWLTMVEHLEQPTARGINLLFFLPGAAVALFFRRRQGTIQWKQILPPAAAGCLAAWACSRLSTAVDNSIFQKAFGVLLIAAGVRELLWKEKHREGA